MILTEGQFKAAMNIELHELSTEPKMSPLFEWTIYQRIKSIVDRFFKTLDYLTREKDDETNNTTTNDATNNNRASSSW